MRSEIAESRYEYIHEIEVSFENISACHSGAQMALFSERNWGYTSGDTEPLTIHI